MYIEMSSSLAAGNQNGSCRGETKVFVGGLAWETQKESMKKYFEQFGEISEAVVIYDKNTGRSKGYGFVTFKEAEAARKACVDPAPVIDGRSANCNLASLGLGVHNHRSTRPSSTPLLGGGKNLRVMKCYEQRQGGGVAFSWTPTLPHYAIQQGIPIPSAFYGYSPNYTCPTTYYGGSSSNVVYGNANSSSFYPYMQYGYPHHFHQYPIIASSSALHYAPPIPHNSQPTPTSASASASVSAAPTVGPHYVPQTNSLRPIKINLPSS